MGSNVNVRTILLVMIGFCNLVQSSTCPTYSVPICSSSSECNGGTCLRGICSCPNGKIGDKCFSTDAFLNAGNVIITQGGFDFSPIEYFRPIEEAYEKAKIATLSTASYDGPCTNDEGNNLKSYKVTIPPISPDKFVKSNLIQSSIKFQIINGGLRASAKGDYQISRARLDLWGGAFCCPCTGSDCTDFLCPHVCSSGDASDWLDMDFQASISADILLSYSSSLQGIVPTVTNVAIAFDDSSLGASLNCPTQSYQLISNMVKSAFNSMKGQLESLLKPQLEIEMTNAANKVAARYQGVQGLQAYPGIYILYKIVALTIIQGRSIVSEVQTKVIYEHFHNDTKNILCYINSTYADTSDDKSVVPPRTWSPITKALSPSGIYSPILAATRFSRSFFNAMTWATFQNPSIRRRSFLATASNGLSASTTFVFSVPFFNIPNDGNNGRLRSVVSGSMSFSCPPTKVGNILSFNFNNLDASFTLAYDDSPPDPSIAFQIVPQSFDLSSVSSIISADSSLNNPALLKSALLGGMNFKTSQLDSFLLAKGNGVLVLPKDLQSSFPDAQLNIYSQGSDPPPAINDASGYIEMINRCACSSSSKPLTGQGIDGTVNICPVSFLNQPYCTAIARRLRTRSLSKFKAVLRKDGKKAISRRILATDLAGKVETFLERLLVTQQEQDLATVLGSLGTQCVTKFPTLQPTTRTPTNTPTKRPSKSPSKFDPDIPVRVVCGEKNGCYYDKNVFFFVCKAGFREEKSCRVENSDIYCCPTSRALINQSAFVLSSLLLSLSVILNII